MDLLGLHTYDFSVLTLLSLRLTSTLSRVMYGVQLCLVIVVALGSIDTYDISNVSLEWVFFGYTCLCLLTAACTFLPLVSRHYSVVRKSDSTEIRFSQTKEKWMNMLVYVAASLIVAVMTWGHSYSNARTYPDGTVPSRIVRMNTIGLFQFTAISQLVTGFQFVWPDAREKEDDGPEAAPLVQRRGM